MIYRMVKKSTVLRFDDASDYMLTLMELGNCHKIKFDVFELSSDKGRRSRMLHWYNPFSDF